MLLQSSSSPQDPHPGKARSIVHILLALNIHTVAASGHQPTEAATVGKKQRWSSATSWRFHGEVHAPFSTLSWTLSRAAHPVPLPAQVWDEDICILYHQTGRRVVEPSTPPRQQSVPGGCQVQGKHIAGESPWYKTRCALRESVPCTPERAGIKLSNY